jgi:hypothetical protein
LVDTDIRPREALDTVVTAQRLARGGPPTWSR